MKQILNVTFLLITIFAIYMTFSLSTIILTQLHTDCTYYQYDGSIIVPVDEIDSITTNIEDNDILITAHYFGALHQSAIIDVTYSNDNAYIDYYFYSTNSSINGLTHFEPHFNPLYIVAIVLLIMMWIASLAMFYSLIKPDKEGR